jgi:hypothetical protein
MDLQYFRVRTKNNFPLRWICYSLELGCYIIIHEFLKKKKLKEIMKKKSNLAMMIDKKLYIIAGCN